MPDRLTLVRGAVFLAVSGVFLACAASLAFAADINSEALRRDAQSLTSDARSAALFTADEIAKLQQMISQPSGDEAIDQALAGKAALEVTINPEARVSILRTQAPLNMPQCGKSGAWLVRIINQGFVTAGLSFQSVAPLSAKLLSLEPVTPRLTGAAVEYRALHFMMNETHQMEVTLGVDAGPATSDIGERAKLPLLLQCK